jgi:hypothetical protein
MIDVSKVKTTYKTRSNNVSSSYGSGYLGTIGVGNITNTNTSPAYTLPFATSDRLGGIMLGDTLVMNEEDYKVNVDLSSYFEYDDSGNIAFKAPIFASNGVFDSVTVNGSFKASEYVVDKIRATNGSLMVTDSAIVKQVGFGNSTNTNVFFNFENNVNPFKKGDVILHQLVSGYSVESTRYSVINTLGYICVCIREDGTEMTRDNIPQAGDSLIRVSGSYIALKGSEGVLEVVDGEDVKTRLGKLSNGEYGLETDNAYIEGDIISKQYAMKASTVSVYDVDGEVGISVTGGDGVVTDNIVPMIGVDNMRLSMKITSDNVNGIFVFFKSLDSLHDGAEVRIEAYSTSSYTPTIYIGNENYNMIFVGDTNGSINGIDIQKGFTIIEMKYSDMMKNTLDNHSGLFITNKTTYKL